MARHAKIRLFVNADLSASSEIELDESQSHYLLNVMKQTTGSEILVFDNAHGEFGCRITAAGKKSCRLSVGECLRSYQRCPDIWLLFAPVKKDQTDFIIQKAVELGVRAIFPIITARTIAEKVKLERFAAQAVEAAEQCRRVDLPEIYSAQSLAEALKKWPSDRKLYYMDETLKSASVSAVFPNSPNSAAILVGPEGGFAPEELELLRRLPFAEGVTLGSRILRAETAVAAALSCWQALAGDWAVRKGNAE